MNSSSCAHVLYKSPCFLFVCLFVSFFGFVFFFSNFTLCSELQINVFKSVMPGQCMLVVLLRKISMVFPLFEWIRVSRKRNISAAREQ